jgi:hypothetical protein
MADSTTISAHELPAECIADCSAPTAVGDAVDFWLREPRVATALARIAPAPLRRHLAGYGRWDAADLADDYQCQRRLNSDPLCSISPIES